MKRKNGLIRLSLTNSQELQKKVEATVPRLNKHPLTGKVLYKYQIHRHNQAKTRKGIMDSLGYN